MNKIKRALVSVYDKTGILPFVESLNRMGVEIISTGGTYKLLKEKGIPATEVSSVTEFPEMLDGRVKTLHPKIHGGLLALRDNPEHVKTIQKHGIEPIDLVVINLYPFEETVRTKTDEHDIIEMIDIGGPAMLRSASKNFRFVGVVCDPSDYASVQKELEDGDGALSQATLKRLAGKVFERTSAYDRAIASYFSGQKPQSLAEFPQELTLGFKKLQDLRYGENPHQKGVLYEEVGSKMSGAVKAKKLHGKELSFNNILDLDAALEMVEAFSEPACSIVKHTSPCGFAISKDLTTAFKKAHACDPLSAFGGIIGFNQVVDEKTAKAILASGFVECVIAKGFDAKALAVLQTKKNLRLLSTKIENQFEKLDFKKVKGGLLLQEKDLKDSVASDLKVVTKLKPKKSQISDLLIAFKISRFVKSNAIVIVKGGATLGLGMGQPSRVDACQTALRKAGKKAKGAVLASDGFFPKPDSIQFAAKAGISAIIQPGGSIADEEIIKACDKAKIAMVSTGLRHFKH